MDTITNLLTKNHEWYYPRQSDLEQGLLSCFSPTGKKWLPLPMYSCARVEWGNTTQRDSEGRFCLCVSLGGGEIFYVSVEVNRYHEHCYKGIFNFIFMVHNPLNIGEDIALVNSF